MKTCDAIIVGASFAGLAVANQLRGHRVLLLDRKPVGAGQTSACGTILSVLQYWDLTHTLLQVHDRLVMHTKWNEIEFHSPYPWCTFDYRRLCETLFRRSKAEFLKASVKGFEDGQVCTDHGNFRASCVVDASGWHSVLVPALSTTWGRTPPMDFGLETICAANEKVAESSLTDGLHFWYDLPIMPHGVGWAFPRGKEIGLAVGSYRGAQPMRKPLELFIRKFDLHPASYHGTYLLYRLRFAVAGPIFLVGDAAGMCIGLTGEGIRPALYFGEICGKIIRKVLEGGWTLKEGLAKYAAFVQKQKCFFDVFSTAQEVLTRLLPAWVDRIAYIVVRERTRKWLFQRYWELTAAWTPLDSRGQSLSNASIV